MLVDLTQVVAISTFALVFNYSVTNIAAYRLKNEPWAEENHSSDGISNVHFALRVCFVCFTPSLADRYYFLDCWNHLLCTTKKVSK